MGIQLTEEEAWEFLEQSHTGIFTTLRADGVPLSLPIWFVTMDRAIYTRGPSKAKRVARVRRDDRACFLVESGEQWIELKAVLLTGHVSIVDDAHEITRVSHRFDAKYPVATRLASPPPKAAVKNADSRVALPEATKKHYGSGATTLRFDPDERQVSWSNAKIRLVKNEAG